MTSLTDRLSDCFLAVFPELSHEEVPRATAASISQWDSVAIVTVAALVEEEFRITIAPDEYEQLTSFALVLNLVQHKLSNGAS